MHRSSIFNFSTYQARWRPSYWIVLLALFVGISELLLRNPAVTAQLPNPEPTLWHTALIQDKMEYLQAFEATHDIDILFIGNSTMQAGVNPQIFDAARMAGSDRGAFNAAIEGLPPYGVVLFLEIYLRYTHPETIIYGLTPQDLNSNSPWAKDVTGRVKNSSLAWAQAHHGLRGRLAAAMFDISNLYRYRFLLHQILLRGGRIPPEPEVYFDARGYHPLANRLMDVPAAARGMYANRAGVLNYSTQGVQLESLRKLIALCTEHQIQLILVNMPLADDYFGNFDKPEDYQTYLTILQQVAREHHIPLWDAENLPADVRFGDAEFADFNHLNVAGAEKLSLFLAEQYVAFSEHDSVLMRP